MNNKVLLVDSFPINFDGERNLNYLITMAVSCGENIWRQMVSDNGISLAEFTRFYFQNRKDIIVKISINDISFERFLAFFASQFSFRDKNVIIELIDILNDIYCSHSKEQNNSLIDDIQPDQLVAYLNELKNNALIRENNAAAQITSKCTDIINAAIAADPKFKYAADTPNSLRVFSCNEILEKSEEQLRMEGELYVCSNQLAEIANTWASSKTMRLVVNTDDNIYHYFQLLLSQIELLVDKATYSYEHMTDFEKNELTFVWALLSTARFSGIVTKSFIGSAKKIMII